MQTMQPKTIEKYFFFGLMFATLVFAFFIFQPFWIVLVLGASLSIVLYPVYLWLKKIRLPNAFAAFITLLFFFIVLCIPFLSIGSLVFKQSQNLYHSVVNNGIEISFLDSIESKINQVLPEGVSFNTKDTVSTVISYLTKNMTTIFNTTVTALFSFILLLLTIFYFLKDGESWKKIFLRLSPLSNTDDEKILDKLFQTINSVMKGYLFIALVQGIAMGIGLTIFQVPNSALWAVVAGIASIVPPMGTAVVSVPAIIFLYTTGHVGLSIGLMIWAILMVGTIDNLLNPYIVGHKINIPPFLILFAVLGGISLLGPIGILVGPLTISLLYTLTEIYRNEFK